MFELPGEGLGGLTLFPNCFFNPPNTLLNYALGVSYTCTIYIGFTSQFRLGSDRRKVQPPANFSQFKHWAEASSAAAFHGSNVRLS